MIETRVVEVALIDVRFMPVMKAVPLAGRVSFSYRICSGGVVVQDEGFPEVKPVVKQMKRNEMQTEKTTDKRLFGFAGFER